VPANQKGFQLQLQTNGQQQHRVVEQASQASHFALASGAVLVKNRLRRWEACPQNRIGRGRSR